MMISCSILLWFVTQTTGAIVGSVKDASDAVIPGVQVSAVYVATAQRQTTVSNEVGQYGFPFLSPSQYRMEFTLPGFKTITRNLTLNISQRIGIDVVMEPSGTTETVQVSGEAPLVQTESATLG